MKLYRIRHWNGLYENNRTRELKKLDWFPMPNKQDGDGYTSIMENKNGAAILGSFVACAQIASRCDPRGTLMRDCKIPHDSKSLSRMSRIPHDIIQLMLDVCSSGDVKWLEINDIQIECDNPAPTCDNPATGCLEGKGREGKGKNYIVELEILNFLNFKSGRGFRPTELNFEFIEARLKEPEVTVEGVKKMIERQCLVWIGNPEMEKYLRPETLFNRTKFDSYYAAKDLPASKDKPINGKLKPREVERVSVEDLMLKISPQTPQVQ